MGARGIVVEDLGNNESRIYNFGLYSFDNTMLLRFVMGRLIFSVGDFSAPGYLKYYEKMNRDVRIQSLNLSPKKRLEMAEALAINVLPENKDYLYDHYRDNCSTRLRDVIDNAVDGALFKATNIPGRMTLRGHTRRYTGHNFIIEMLLEYLMNNEIDKPITQWDEMFLPDELEKNIEELNYVDENGDLQKLVSDYFIFYKADRHKIPDKVQIHWPFALMAGIIFGIPAIAIALWMRTPVNSWPNTIYGIYTVTIGLVFGIPGLLLALLASFTEHSVTYYNENLLLANPVTFLLIPIGVAITLNKLWSWTWLKWVWFSHLILVGFAIALKVLPIFYQDNWLIISLILPLYLFNGFAMRMISDNNSIS